MVHHTRCTYLYISPFTFVCLSNKSKSLYPKVQYWERVRKIRLSRKFSSTLEGGVGGWEKGLGDEGGRGGEGRYWLQTLRLPTKWLWCLTKLSLFSKNIATKVCFSVSARFWVVEPYLGCKAGLWIRIISCGSLSSYFLCGSGSSMNKFKNIIFPKSWIRIHAEPNPKPWCKV